MTGAALLLLCPGKCFLLPCRKRLHVRFDATSESHCSQCFSEDWCLLIYFWGFFFFFLGKHCCLPQVPLYWGWPCLISGLVSEHLSEFTCHVHKMVLLVYRITGPRSCGASYCGSKQRKQACIIITISANCGDGSVTVSVDMLHIVSITPNCCSRPCHRKMLKILHVWSCGLLWNWKWMVINYNDDHHGERFCATGYLTVWASLCRVGLKKESPLKLFWRILHVDLKSHMMKQDKDYLQINI